MKISASLLALLCLSLLPALATADVFKCKDENGTTTFSQTPCQSAPSEQVNVGVPKKIPAAICGHAYDFSLEVTGRMRANTSAASEKAAVGGRFAGSIAAASIIDYVHTFAGNHEINSDGIASLTMSKCVNGGFGNVTADDIPHRKPEEQLKLDQQAQMEAARAEAQARAAAQQSRQYEAERSDSPPENDSMKLAESGVCTSYRKTLQNVEDAMRRGYSSAEGERLRDQARHYQQRIRAECR